MDPRSKLQTYDSMSGLFSIHSLRRCEDAPTRKQFSLSCSGEGAYFLSMLLIQPVPQET